MDLGRIVTQCAAQALLAVLSFGCSGAANPSSAPDPAPPAPALEQPTEPSLGTGCDGEATSTAACAPPTPAAPAAGTYRGTYFVPVPDELTSYALFELDGIRIRTEGDDVLLRYDLPALLLGDTRGVSFRGALDASGSAYALVGDDGRATCRSVDGAWTCDEVLHGFELDEGKVARTLASLPELEAQARRAVSERFADDPIGILRLALPRNP